MAERSIILFGKSSKAEKSKRHGGASPIQLPSHTRQTERLTPKMTALQNAVLMLKQSPMGIEAEKTLVFSVVGDITNFYKAVKKLGDNAEWIFDMPDEFSVSDDFYVLKENKKIKEKTRDEKKNVIGGKVYCVLSNVRAIEEILSLWERFRNNPNISFPDGKTGLRDVFKHLEDIRFWGYKERVEETGILEIWNEELQDPDIENVKCEIELFFRSNPNKRIQNEQQLRTQIEALGGTIISSSTIPDISYHAAIATVPRNVAEDIIKGNRNVSIVTAEQIMFFRPVGQAVFISKENSFDDNFKVPPNDNMFEEPIIALFDGLPQENHPYLTDRLIVDDPDGYADTYVVEARKHGTSMASLIALGDLQKTTHAATHKIYVRPIMKPVPRLNDYSEQIPNDNLLVDKIHTAVRRLFADEAGRIASTVKVINFSIGISYRQFDRSMSPLARLLDWLSWRYRVLFIVSAGNHTDSINVGMNFKDFSLTDIKIRDQIIIKHLNNNSRNQRLLSPAESVNALTVGATFEDNSSFIENEQQILPCSNGLPSAISSLGMGMNNAVKPDIIFAGGRNLIRQDLRDGLNSPIAEWVDSPKREPGTASAAPFIVGSQNKVMYTFGTSNAATLISHEASRCYDTLLEVFEKMNKNIPEEHVALLIKAMLVHGAEWGWLLENFTNTLEITNRQDYSRKLHRFLGYGKPDIERAIECARNRITLIGYGDLRNGEAIIYNLPLPFNFSSSKICRRLTATLTYFSPFIPTRQKYRAAQLWYEIETGTVKKFLDNRVDIDWQAAVRGSVQHEIFENTDTVVWNEDDELKIKVNCRADADEEFAGSVPYALMVSFEIKDAIDIDVYTLIAEKVRPRVTV